MGFELRGYQKEVVSKGIEYFNSDSKKKSIIVAPVAAGKSICIAEIARALKGNTVVFQPRKELLEQNARKIMSYGASISICSASFNSFNVGKLTYATIGTVVNRLELFSGEWNVIIDEAHMMSPEHDGMYNRFFSHINATKVLGFTATPFRVKRDSQGVKLSMINRMRPKVFNNIIHTVQISELKDKYWSPIKYEIYNDGINDILDLKAGNTNDYDDDTVHKAFETYNVLHETIYRVRDLLSSGRKNIIIFVKNLDYAETYHSSIKDSEVVSSKHSSEHNEKTIKDFNDGKLKVLINCEKLTTGFDCPKIDALIQCRPTRSFILYYQIIGRAVRLHPEGKDCLIIDMVGNYERFGDIRNLKIDKNAKGLDCAYMSGELITNIPYSKAKYNKTGTKGATKKDGLNIKVGFGKYRGKTLKTLLKDKMYVRWVYLNVDKTYNDGDAKVVKIIKREYEESVFGKRDANFFKPIIVKS